MPLPLSTRRNMRTVGDLDAAYSVLMRRRPRPLPSQLVAMEETIVQELRNRPVLQNSTLAAKLEEQLTRFQTAFAQGLEAAKMECMGAWLSTLGTAVVQWRATCDRLYEADGQVQAALMQRSMSQANARARLKAWLREHLDDPYPNPHEKEQMMRETGLSYKQVTDWFVNARKRLLPVMLRERYTQHDLSNTECSDS